MTVTTIWAYPKPCLGHTLLSMKCVIKKKEFSAIQRHFLCDFDANFQQAGYVCFGNFALRKLNFNNK